LSRLQELVRALNLNPPADESSITECERRLARKLPQEYREFLLIGSGGEGFVGEGAYAILYRCEELAEMNEGYKVEEYAPGLLVFGSDGGDEAYGFDMRDPATPIVMVPFMFEWKEARTIGRSFTEFLEWLKQPR
jgi:hypothetical protein